MATKGISLINAKDVFYIIFVGEAFSVRFLIDRYFLFRFTAWCDRITREKNNSQVKEKATSFSLA